MNLATVVRVNARNHPQKTAIVCGEQTYTYAEAWSAIEGIAATLIESGVGSGDRVGLSMRDHPLHLLAHYAIARIGAIIVPIDHRWTVPERAAAASTFATRLVLTDGADIEDVTTHELTEGCTRGNVDCLPAMSADDCTLLISLSSGTTGKPKGALVTHRNLYERFVSQWVAIGFDAQEVFGLVTPLCFGAGRSFGMCMLAAGATVKLAPPPLAPDELLTALADPVVTATFLPPTLLRRLLPLAQPDSRLLDNLRFLIVSGEPLYAAEAADIRRVVSERLVGYYASSEGGGISVLSSADFAEHAATVGTPTFRTEVDIVDADDVSLPSGEVGRLRYRGPGVATRFVNQEGFEQEGHDGGWFYPGDLAERLPSGHLALRGRDKDVVVRGGINVYPAEIEAVLQQHPDVRECAVVGRTDAARGEIIAAYVVCSASDEELEAHCRDRLAPYKIPASFNRLDTLPKASSGKIDKGALQ